MFVAVEAKSQVTISDKHIIVHGCQIDTTEFEYDEFVYEPNAKPYKFVRLRKIDYSNWDGYSWCYMFRDNKESSIEQEPGNGAITFTEKEDIENAKLIAPYIDRWLERQKKAKEEKETKDNK